MLSFDRLRLEALVMRTFGAAPSHVDPMPGGASTRQYYRLQVGGRRVVAMFVPDARPEEISSGAPSLRWPFLEVQALLKGAGVRVPEVLAEDCEGGLLLLEDLGDRTLAAYLEQEPEGKAAIYTRAVKDLARAQLSLKEQLETSVVGTRAFDDTLLRWELDHFREWGLDGRGRALEAGDRAVFDALADRLAHRIAEMPRGFVHRDYQSRNLMVLGEGEAVELAWIDFQDALLGPRSYDLVALLQDSYQTFDRAFVEARLDDYAAEAGLDAGAREKLGREFDLITVQRKLKDAGRFVFIDRVKGNPAFLPFVEPTLAKVRVALERLSDDPDLRSLGRIVERA